MSCSSCDEIKATDHISPMCETGKCPIPPLEYAGTKVLEMRQMFIELAPLVGKAPVLEMFRATPKDMRLLAKVEEFLRENQRGQSNEQV